MSPRSLAHQLRESPNALKHVALALALVAGILVIFGVLGHPMLR